MKKNFHRLFSVTMATMVLVSTVSWTVSKHYCMGRLMNVALFAHADDCCMDMVNSESDDIIQISNENSCCDNELILISGQDELVVSLNDLKLDQQYFLVFYVQSYQNLLKGNADQALPHKQYPPPILVKNIQLLDEVFLI